MDKKITDDDILFGFNAIAKELPTCDHSPILFEHDNESDMINAKCKKCGLLIMIQREKYEAILSEKK